MPSPSIYAAPPVTPAHKPAFVGGKVVVHGSINTHLPVHMRSVPLDCPDVAGGLICLRCPETDRLLWFPVDGMAWIEMADEATAPPPGVDDAQVADALAAFKAHPGPLVDTGG